MMCTILESLLTDYNDSDTTTDNSKIYEYICQSFIFSYLWSLGSNLIDSSQSKFEDLVFNQFKDTHEVTISPDLKLLDVYLNTETKTFENWNCELIIFILL